jgi:DNA-binding transcriptional LysR family regulator
MSAPRHTLDQLLVLEAIEREGTFAAAARALHRVPSAISYTVKSLEDALGCPLFDRAGHTASLNANGRRLLEEGRAVLEHARRLDRVAGALHSGWEPELAVVVDGVYPTAPLMQAVSAFTALGTPTRLKIHVEFQSGVVARFKRDDADLMLMLEFDGTGAWAAQALPNLEMVLVCAAGHPVASLEAVDRDEIRRHAEIVVRDSAPEFAEVPREAWFGSRDVVLLSDFHSKLIAIRAAAGIGWLPRWLAQPHLDSGSLAMVPFDEGNHWTYRPHIIHRRDIPLGRAGRAFLDTLLAAVAPYEEQLAAETVEPATVQDS